MTHPVLSVIQKIADGTEIEGGKILWDVKDRNFSYHREIIELVIFTRHRNTGANVMQILDEAEGNFR